MLYHTETVDGVLTYDRDDADRRAVVSYFADKGQQKPQPIRVRGWPFKCIYLTHGTEEGGLFVAVRNIVGG
jgi:hypothetical protein